MRGEHGGGGGERSGRGNHGGGGECSMRQCTM